ncbi:serpentine type 7TM GPCR chemoreceptor srx domain-containing protein [Ditylenchus destructor]|nr:serpentine type 7TM GPCR chemoreceptor srx domain-containing protein [Ditylenchus destructor]
METTARSFTATEKLIGGLILLLLSVSFTIFYIYTLIALHRVSKKNSTFILFFSQGIAHILILPQFLWLSLEVLSRTKTPLPNISEALILQLPTLVSQIHIILIPLNRAHAVFFPLSYEKFWTRRFSLTSALLSWICGFSLAIYSVYGVQAPDTVFGSHDAEKIALSSVVSNSDPKLAEAFALQHFFGRYIYMIVAGTAVSIYATTLMKIIWEKCEQACNPSFNSSSHFRRQMNARVRLFFLCFITFIPNILMTLQNYLIRVPAPYGDLIITLEEILSISVDPFVLVALSSLVRAALPGAKRFKCLSRKTGSVVHVSAITSNYV